MNMSEIEQQRYIKQMRLKSVEEKLKSVDPFSEDFENLIDNAITLKNDIRQLSLDLIREKVYGV